MTTNKEVKYFYLPLSSLLIYIGISTYILYSVISGNFIKDIFYVSAFLLVGLITFLIDIAVNKYFDHKAWEQYKKRNDLL